MGIMKHGHDASRGSNANHDHPIATSPSETSPSEIAPSETRPSEETRGQSKGYALIAVVYLLGLIMGALDMSIVNPARTVIQNTMSVNDALGVWVITIYTLAYAAAIPIMGKLADRHGRKSVYLLCILLFGGGDHSCADSRALLTASSSCWLHVLFKPSAVVASCPLLLLSLVLPSPKRNAVWP